jgi:hypothetical protein
MEISNFISESERHELLYSLFDNRHKEIITMFKKIRDENISENHIYTSLKHKGVSESEIRWLQRLGYYLP